MERKREGEKRNSVSSPASIPIGVRRGSVVPTATTKIHTAALGRLILDALIDFSTLAERFVSRVYGRIGGFSGLNRLSQSAVGDNKSVPRERWGEKKKFRKIAHPSSK